MLPSRDQTVCFVIEYISTGMNVRKVEHYCFALDVCYSPERCQIFLHWSKCKITKHDAITPSALRTPSDFTPRIWRIERACYYSPVQYLSFVVFIVKKNLQRNVKDFKKSKSCFLKSSNFRTSDFQNKKNCEFCRCNSHLPVRR